MTDINAIVDEVARLVASDAPALAEMRMLLVDLDEVVHSAEYGGFSAGDRARFQAAYKELRDAIRRQESGVSGAASTNTAAPSFETNLGASTGIPPAVEAPAVREHLPLAEGQMEEAEKLFYGGRYSEAIKLYDIVLQLEPRWERARQHRGEAESYLRTGHIPSVALPPEAASAFGKAQSAARLGRYADALSMLNRAQLALRDIGIQRWMDGQEFEQKLQQYIDAESVYAEGVGYFTQGLIDDGIERVEAAAQATGLPKYMDRAQEMRKAKTGMQSIAEALNNANNDPKSVIQVKAGLDALYLQFGDNPAFVKLRERFQALIPAVAEPLKDQVRSLKTQADRAQTIDAVTVKARQAKELLSELRNLGYTDESLGQLQGDIERLFREIERYEDELQQALTVYNSNRSWPAAAAQISQNVRSRFPNDPRVVEINQLLVPYRNTRLAIRIGLIFLVLAVLAVIGLVGYNAANNYFLALTPTATATPTITPTVTPLPPTATATPRPTSTPTVTPTPPSAVVQRDVWVRNGCYETFRAIGQIPAGTVVRFLPVDRRFDNINRECALVEFTAEDKTTLAGWVLIADLGK